MRLGGGVPVGRVLNMYGSKGSNKTTATYRMMKTFTEYGFRCKRFDAEQQDDKEWMEALGVPLDKVVLSPEHKFDKVWDAVIDEVENDAFDVFFIDSLDVLLHSAIEKKKTGDDDMALTARKMSQRVFPRLLGPLADKGKILIIIFQARADIGGSSNLAGYSGGNACKHDSSLDLWFRRAGMSAQRASGTRFKVDNFPVGFPVAARVMKSKMYGVPEGCEAAYDFYFNKGIDNEATMFEEAWRTKRLISAGAYYTINNEKGEELIKGQGADGVINALKDDKELYNRVSESLSKEKVDIISVEEAQADTSEITKEEKAKESERETTKKAKTTKKE